MSYLFQLGMFQTDILASTPQKDKWYQKNLPAEKSVGLSQCHVEGVVWMEIYRTVALC